MSTTAAVTLPVRIDRICSLLKKYCDARVVRVGPNAKRLSLGLSPQVGLPPGGKVGVSEREEAGGSERSVATPSGATETGGCGSDSAPHSSSTSTGLSSVGHPDDRR